MTRKVGSDVNLMAMNEPPGLVPDVTGMGLRDALYALESRGLKAEVNGYGRVSTQNISPGTKVSGQKVVIRLE